MPVTLSSRCVRNRADGLETSASPSACMAKTPISSVPPKRFLIARRMRYWWLRSPSKLSTVSTICSSTRGPAMLPSLVTWPTSTSAVPRSLAKRISSCALARTWLTVPGAPSIKSECIVWIESITSSASGRPLPRVVRMSRTEVAEASRTGASPSPRRRARSRT